MIIASDGMKFSDVLPYFMLDSDAQKYVVPERTYRNVENYHRIHLKCCVGRFITVAPGEWPVVMKGFSGVFAMKWERRWHYTNDVVHRFLRIHKITILNVSQAIKWDEWFERRFSFGVHKKPYLHDYKLCGGAENYFKLYEDFDYQDESPYRFLCWVLGKKRIISIAQHSAIKTLMRQEDMARRAKNQLEKHGVL